MAEYIDRDILIKNIEQETMNILFTKSTALKYIRGAPAADVAEVRHGRWEDKTNISRAEVEQRVDCSVCGQIFWTTAVLSFNYCPNCGALMKEDEHETG